MERRGILFDLDGTLLPQDMEEFGRAYFALLAKKAAPYGYEPEKLVQCVWRCTAAMTKNDGTVSNRDRFWAAFAEIYGEGVYDHIPVFNEFYTREFHQARPATRPNPLAKAAVELAHRRGDAVILATNPLFPADGIYTRMSWIGLTPEDFDLVTAYENSCYAKPNPAYYSAILKEMDLLPRNCLMIGNDTGEDILPAGSLGMDTFLITDCLIHRGGPLPQGPRGSFSDMMSFLEAWPEIG